MALASLLISPDALDTVATKLVEHMQSEMHDDPPKKCHDDLPKQRR